eukprot:TRINITY_DN10896_c0_g1_i1.p1 TRINITY_DN10896_c0_g1~~TRINITY_DN10896_c0_g1_i1.p1  ORF type:complete len:578 (+),score=123.33 TRINITY_DN10896_c0_g1_i1:296-2029(+)
MGAAIPVGAVVAPDLAAIAQDWHFSSRNERLARLSYELDFQGLRLDFISTIREEIRDQVSFILSGLDNLMVVATLMMSIGFGFVVEGTFPPSSAEELKDWYIPFTGVGVDPLVIYSFLCAMSLIMPFWCLIFTIRLRYEVDLIVRGHMTELRRQLCNVLKRNKIEDPERDLDDGCEDANSRFDGDAGGLGHRAVSSSLIAAPAAMKREWRRALCPARVRKRILRCPDRVQKTIEETADDLAKHVGPYSLTQEPVIEREQILRWADQDLQGRMTHYMFYLTLAHSLLWMGMVAAIFTCALLLGMYMMENFPNTTYMWQAYSYPVCLSGLLAIAFAGWMWFLGPAPARNTHNCLWNSHSRSFSDVDGCGMDRTPVRGSLSSPLLGGRRDSAFMARRELTPTTWKNGYGNGFNNGFGSPMRRKTERFDDCSHAASASSAHSLPAFELRVQLAGSGANRGYRRVVFSGTECASGTRRAAPPFAEIRRRILEKFRDASAEPTVSPGGSGSSQGRSSGSAGSAAASDAGNHVLVSLMRVRDELEIGDDEDAALLLSGDRLEVVLEHESQSSLLLPRRALSKRS